MDLRRIADDRARRNNSESMTKPRRIILLVADIVTLLAGIASISIAMFLLTHTDWHRVPSRESVLAAPTEVLRTRLRLAVEGMGSLVSMIEDAQDRFPAIRSSYGERGDRAFGNHSLANSQAA